MIFDEGCIYIACVYICFIHTYFCDFCIIDVSDYIMFFNYIFIDMWIYCDGTFYIDREDASNAY